MTAYRDRDGDVWVPYDEDMYKTPGEYARSLESVRSSFGPLTPLTEETREAPAMTRGEALAKATEHVNTLSTNSRGYQDGVRFTDKVAAVERLARFLAGDAAADEDA